MKKQNLGGILSIKKNVVSRLNASNVNAQDAMGGSLTQISLCASCSQEECCPGGDPPTKDSSSWCRCI